MGPNKFTNKPTELPKWLSHTQDAERIIKIVTEASLKYFTQGKRDGAIRLQNKQTYLWTRI